MMRTALLVTAAAALLTAAPASAQIVKADPQGLSQAGPLGLDVGTNPNGNRANNSTVDFRIGRRGTGQPSIQVDTAQAGDSPSATTPHTAPAGKTADTHVRVDGPDSNHDAQSTQGYSNLKGSPSVAVQPQPNN